MKQSIFSAIFIATVVFSCNTDEKHDVVAKEKY